MFSLKLAEVSITEFVKKRPRYIRVMPENDELMGIAERTVRVDGKQKTIDVSFTTKIPISVCCPDGSLTPKVIHLHYGNAKTLLTLLALKPKALQIKYWYNNSYPLIEKVGLKNETIIFEAKKHEVKITNVIKNDIQRLARF